MGGVEGGIGGRVVVEVEEVGVGGWDYVVIRWVGKLVNSFFLGEGVRGRIRKLNSLGGCVEMQCCNNRKG